MSDYSRQELLKGLWGYMVLKNQIPDPTEREKVQDLISTHLVTLHQIFNYFVALSGDMGAMTREAYRAMLRLSNLVCKEGKKSGKSNKFAVSAKEIDLLFTSVDQHCEKEPEAVAPAGGKGQEQAMEFVEFVFSLFFLAQHTATVEIGLAATFAHLIDLKFAAMASLIKENIKPIILSPQVQEVYKTWIKALAKLYRHIAGKAEQGQEKMPSIDVSEANQMLNLQGLIDAELTKVEVRVAYFMSRNYNQSMFQLRWPEYLEFVARCAQLKYSNELDGVFIKLKSDETAEGLAKKLNTFCSILCKNFE